MNKTRVVFADWKTDVVYHEWCGPEFIPSVHELVMIQVQNERPLPSERLRFDEPTLSSAARRALDSGGYMVGRVVDICHHVRRYPDDCLTVFVSVRPGR
jgi:hypothetical protein